MLYPKNENMKPSKQSIENTGHTFPKAWCLWCVCQMFIHFYVQHVSRIMNKNVLILLRVMVEMTLVIYIYLCFISVRGGYPLWAVWRLGGLQSACFLTVRRNASICSLSMHIVTLPGIYALSDWVGGINEYDWRLDFSSTNSLITP